MDPASRPVERLTRDAFERELERGGLTVFSYIPNRRGFIFLVICALFLFLITSAVHGAMGGFKSSISVALAFVLTSGGLILLALVGYWSAFARRARLAYDERHLFIASMGRVDRVAWRALDLATSGFLEEREGSELGVLHLRPELGARPITMRLFNPFVWLEDMPLFFSEFLGQVKRNADTLESPGAVDEQATDDAG